MLTRRIDLLQEEYISRRDLCTASAACPDFHWGVAQAQPNRLAQAINSVKVMGFETYCPMMMARVRERINGKQASHFTDAPRPMLFQFFFVRFDFSENAWSMIRRDASNGINRLMMKASYTPALAGDRRITEFQMSEVERMQAPQRGRPKIRRGGRALVVRGPFAGSVGVVDRCNGFTTELWLEAFGGSTRVSMARMDVTDE